MGLIGREEVDDDDPCLFEREVLSLPAADSAGAAPGGMSIFID